MKLIKTFGILMAILILPLIQVNAQETIAQTLSLSTNGVNSTEILFYKQDKVSYNSLFSNHVGFGLYNSSTGQTDLIVKNPTGNIGIGTVSPLEKLHIQGNIRWGNETSYLYSGQDRGGVWFEQVSPGSDQSKIRLQTSRSGDLANYAQFYVDAENGFSFQTIGNANGNVGIGTASPKEKLSVNGKIRAHEIKVEQANWPDYVFEDSYKNLSLKEVEKFIKKNKHLPDMPTAAAIEKNGLALGEIVKLQQQKIEELTLHLIEKDKELSKEKETNKNQNERLKAVEIFLKKLTDKK